MGNKIKLLAISGSLRDNSSNTNILRMMALMREPDVEVILYTGLANLPHFNPILDNEDSSVPVKEFRQLLLAVDGVIICTPEYAFGIPGSLKNALDWTVSTGSFASKPVAVITASLGGERAHAALLQVFTALSAIVDESATLLIPFIRTKLDTNGAVSDPSTIHAIRSVLAALITCIKISEACTQNSEEKAATEKIS